MRSERYTVDDPAFRAEVERLYATGERTGAITHAVGYHRDGVETLVSPDRHATLIAIRLAHPETKSVEQVTAVLRELAGRGEFEVGMTGAHIVDHDFGEALRARPPEGRAALRPAGGADHARARLRRARRRLAAARCSGSSRSSSRSA